MSEYLYPQMKIIETKEYILRPVEMTDVRDLFEIYKEERVVKYLPFNAHKNIIETKKFIQSFFINNYKLGKIGHWAIVSKIDKKVIGHIGLNNASNGDRSSEIGICINPAYWGSDIATPLTICSLKYGFEYLNMDKLIASTYESNKYTPKSLEKLGFRYTKTVNKKITSHIYELSKQDYLVNKNKGVYSNIAGNIKIY